MLMSRARVREMAPQPEPPDRPGLAARLRLPEQYWLLALLLAAFYFVTCLYISAQRLLWFDEILTALITRFPDLHTMRQALSEIAEQTPPLYFMITRVFDRMFQHADIGLRVPSVLAFGAGLLVTFDSARRLTNGLYGLIAMSLAATPFVTYYGYEARSYALYFLLAGLALWLWLFTKADSRIAAVAFGAVFLLGAGIHYYVLVCLVPFAITALTERRPFHPKIVGAAIGAMVSLALLYPELASSRTFAKTVSPVWAPSLPRLVAAYLEFLPNAILPLVVIGIVIAARRKPAMHTAPRISEGERVCWLFLLVPLVAYLLGILVTHLFHDRYIVGAAPGMVVGATCLMWRHCRDSKYLSLALLLASTGSAVGLQARTLWNVHYIEADSGDYQERTRQILALEDMLSREGKQHVVLDWDVRYLETWYYSKHRDLYECITAEQRWALKKYVPLRFVSVEQIVANARRTAVIAPSPSLAESLTRAGLRLSVRVAGPLRVVYLE